MPPTLSIQTILKKANALKNKSLIITTIIFFLIINTTYYWEGKLGLWAMPATIILIIVYFALAIALLRQVYFAIREKSKDKSRLITIGLLALVLTLTFIKPFGLINFDILEGDNILIAGREGSANCRTTLKLKDDFTFRESSICFGVTEIKGTYHLQNDTIYFDKVELGRHENEFYTFAVVKNSKIKDNGNHFALIRYYNLKDTIGHELWITKNDLYKLKDKKPNR